MDLFHYVHALKQKDLKRSQNHHHSEYRHHTQQSQYLVQMFGNHHQCSQTSYEYHEQLLLNYFQKYQQRVVS